MIPVIHLLLSHFRDDMGDGIWNIHSRRRYEGQLLSEDLYRRQQNNLDMGSSYFHLLHYVNWQIACEGWLPGQHCPKYNAEAVYVGATIRLGCQPSRLLRSNELKLVLDTKLPAQCSPTFT